MRGRRLAALAMALAVAACASPSASVAPSGQPSANMATPEASPARSVLPSGSVPPGSEAPPSEAPSPSPPPPSAFQVIPPGSAMQVRVDELNLRRQSSTSARRVAVLGRGTLLVVSPSDFLAAGYGPVAADGYTWYPVMEVDTDDRDGKLDPLPANPIDIGSELVSGWIATDDGAERFVRQVEPRCPTMVDLANVSGMLPAERLACFGQAIVLEGTFGCGGCGGARPGEYRPEWLADPLNFDFLSVDVTDGFGPLTLRFAPRGPDRPEPGSIIRVTVHVDDERASRCEMSELDSGDAGDIFVPVPDETAVFYCREQLVVDSFEVLGTDPNFQGG